LSPADLWTEHPPVERGVLGSQSRDTGWRTSCRTSEPFFCCSKYFGMFFCELYYESSTFASCDQFVACNCGFQLWFARHRPSARPHHFAVRVLRGRTADTSWREKRVDRAPSDIYTMAKTFRRPGRSPVAMLVHSSPGRRHGEERPALGHNTTTPSPHCVARVLRGRSVGTPHGVESARATNHGIRAQGYNDLLKTVPPTCRGVGAVEPRPLALGRARPALGHNTTTPSPHAAKARDSWVARRLLPAADLEGIVWHIGKAIVRPSTLTRSSTKHTIEVNRVAKIIDVW